MNDELAKIVIKALKEKKYQSEDTSFDKRIKDIDNFIEDLERRKKDIETMVNLHPDKKE